MQVETGSSCVAISCVEAGKGSAGEVEWTWAGRGPSAPDSPPSCNLGDLSLSVFTQTWYPRSTKWSRWGTPQPKVVTSTPWTRGVRPDGGSCVHLHQVHVGSGRWPCRPVLADAARCRGRSFELRAAAGVSVHAGWGLSLPGCRELSFRWCYSTSVT